MTQAQFPVPEWPLSECWVVSYVLDGHIKATRHRGGCKVLDAARLALDDGRSVDWYGHRVHNLSVLEEPRYLRLIARGDMPAAEDHVCAKGREVATASFRAVSQGDAS